MRISTVCAILQFEKDCLPSMPREPVLNSVCGTKPGGTETHLEDLNLSAELS